TELRISNRSGETARLILLGGEPFAEEIVMWWNFVGRTHEEIVAFREQWQAEGERFGAVDGYIGRGGAGRNADGLGRLPAPRLPGHSRRLPPRRRPRPSPRAEAARRDDQTAADPAAPGPGRARRDTVTRPTTQTHQH